MTDSAVALPAASARRIWLYLPLALLLLICAGWCVFWFYARDQGNERIDAWLAEERQLGHDWTCAGRSISGFPFRFEFSCDSLAYDAPIEGMSATAPGFHAVALIYQPDRAVAELQSPLQMTLADGAHNVRLDWANFRLSIGGLLGADPHADAVVANPVLTEPGKAAAGDTHSAERLEVHLRRNPDLSATERALDAALTISRLASPPLDRWSQTAERADIAAQFTLTRVQSGKDMTMPEWLELWRQAGGSLNIGHADLVKGSMKLGGSGRLALDGDHRIQGPLNVSAAGMDAVLARAGVPAAALNVGGLLSGLLGGTRADAAATTDGGINLALQLDKGAVFIGPLKLPVKLLPLY